MAVEAPDIAAGQGDHVVQFYEQESELAGAVGPYLTGGIRAGDAAIVIATEAHRRLFQAELRAEGIDLAEVMADGRLYLLDAATAMTAFIDGGQIDRDRFHEVIGGTVREAAGSGRTVRAYGEMVALLWDAGDVLAAIELETLWNDLARELPFSLFCSYPAASVSGSEHAVALHQVCHLHSSVLDRPAEEEHDAADRCSGPEVSASFPAERNAPGRARRMVVAALREWGQEETLVETAALLLSEMANNAVIHARSEFSIAVQAQDSILRITVRDWTPLATTMRDGGLIPRPRHGLALMDALSSRWGVESTPDGKRVWAELAQHETPANR
jgi:anti-sigma regulatory factor (Ser/Thr protein kinase)